MLYFESNLNGEDLRNSSLSEFIKMIQADNLLVFLSDSLNNHLLFVL